MLKLKLWISFGLLYEILDLNSDNVSEDDYLEACIAYVEIAKDVIGQYLDKKI